MNNNLSALNNTLFELNERLMDDEISDEQFQKEVARAAAVVNVATTILRVGELALKAKETAEDCGFYQSNKRQTLPKMLEAE